MAIIYSKISFGIIKMATLLNIQAGYVNEWRKFCTVKVGPRKGGCYVSANGVVKYLRTKGDETAICARMENGQEGGGKFAIPFGIVHSKLQELRPLNELVNFAFSVDLYPHQRDDLAKVVNLLETVGSCLVLARPGYGKTILSMFLVGVIKQRTLVIVPTRINLAKQTRKAYLDYIDRPECVHILGTDGIVPDNCDILIAMVGRLTKVKSGLERFGLVYFDEIHMLNSEVNICSLLTARPVRLVGWTATKKKREDITKLFLGPYEVIGGNTKPWSICFPKIETAIDIPKLRKRIQDGIDKMIKDGKRKMSVAKQDKQMKLFEYTHAITGLTESPRFTRSIVKIVRHFIDQRERVIVITMRKGMTHLLYKKLTKDAQISSPDCSVGQSVQSPSMAYVVDYLDSKKSNCDNCDVLIGTHKKMGTGFDETNAITDFRGNKASRLVAAMSISDFVLWYQVCGRVLRADGVPLVVFPHLCDLTKHGINFSDNHIQALTELVREEVPECVISGEEGNLLEEVAKVDPSEIEEDINDDELDDIAESEISELDDIGEAEEDEEDDQ